MSRWITVANRLPFSLSADGSKLSTSSGGLVSALSGVKGAGERLWLGCAPDNLKPDDWPRVERQLAEKTDQSWKYQPVFVPKPLYDSYYNGLCNDVLWPLLHYQPELVAFNEKSWNAYREVNQRIANEIKLVGEALANGRFTVDEAAAELDRRADAILEKRRWMLDRQAARGAR